ncbi:Tex family protein [Neptuniibacter sp.]|uniref:Tex family protein n=1 Tax=Neptuniibacter sp. TaxID=1962643 RepID=UPI0026032895|nr:Tex family protein [Neptuniibacter sp.]
MIYQKIASELDVKTHQVEAACKLLDEGSTVPFIARYRKEITGALDDGQLRQLQQRLVYLRELEVRKAHVIESINEQGQLTSFLRSAITHVQSKSELEDIYQPYKSKRRTKAQIAQEAGLKKLLEEIITQPHANLIKLSQRYINIEKDFPDAEACLEGANAILADQLVSQPELLKRFRENLWQHGLLNVSVVKKRATEGEKFRDYFEYSEKLKTIPSHRMLAILRGVNEGILKADLDIESETNFEDQLARSLSLPQNDWFNQVVRKTWKSRLRPKLVKELITKQREQAEEEAIRVFSRNLKELLLAAPAGAKCTLGLDPGLRTGVKVAVVDATSKLVDHCTIFPHPPKKQWDQAINTLFKLSSKHNVELISIGNGTGSRETDKLVSELLQKHSDIRAQKLIISEAGASVYSASELAAEEFPNLDVTIRGAVSIARRLQDPLAELVKIEPKAIGVGQYQHDVNQSQLASSLDAVIEDCVNAVGVDLNSASEALLNHISGLNNTLARNIVAYRDENGPFQNRNQLKKVARLGPKAFEQSAAFLRINSGKQILDSSGVHPEAYKLVESIAKKNNRSLEQLIGNSNFLNSLTVSDYTNEQFGEYTVQDILQELDKPGRDPRPEFKTAKLLEGIETLADLREGMQLEGTVTNVTNFGAFVDIGVHQDGLVHISQLADRFVKDPHDIVSNGQIVKVRVTEVDLQRKRIALTMRSQDRSVTAQPKNKREKNTNTGMSAAFKRATSLK